MKKIRFLFIVLCLAISFPSCQEASDLLDPESTTSYTEDEVFTSAQNSMLFLNSIYGRLIPVIPQASNLGTRWRGTDALLEVSTDNGSTNLATSGGFFPFNWGSWTPATNTFSTSDWSDSWAAIRACYLFLSHIDNVPEDPEYNFTTETRNIRKGEALFLLAFNFSELAKQFGGLPLVTKTFAIDDDMNMPRATFDETIRFIVDLCDQAANLLPLSHPDADYGRVTKGAALALKARMLLYAASPLWNNPDKPQDSPFRGAYNPHKWERAAEAAKAVIDLNQYSLHPDISTLFITRVNPELIFVRMNQPSSWITSISVPNKLYPAGANGKSGCNQVTYNMIKEYEVLKNGKAYSVDEAKALGILDSNNPYQNRDPRFYRDCMFNGYLFQNKVTQFGESAPGGPTPAHNPTEISAYYTYVFSIKFADLSLVINWDARRPNYGSPTNQNYPYIRYAEVLLNYAEAMNEAYGPEVDHFGNGKTALWAVNQVRTRATYPAKPEYKGLTGGMPPIPSGLSQAQLREKIRHERRVELSFEEHRFWDVRRWKLDPESNDMLNIKAEIPIWQPDGTVKYEIRTIDTRVFDPKMMYRMPIPQNELYANPKFVQNPGYQYSPEAEE